jgi:hypothetical protein
MTSGSNDLDIASGLIPRRTAATVGMRQGCGRWLDRRTAEHYYDEAGGDPAAARLLAAKEGWGF